MRCKKRPGPYAVFAPGHLVRSSWKATAGNWLSTLTKNLLGKCFLTLNRHEESVSDLSETEWLDLHRQLKRTTKALTEAFAPDHFNYAFLQNQDKHVHFHVIPRFATPRKFAGCLFEDPDFPGHYRVPSPGNMVSGDVLTEVADGIRSTIEKNE